MKSVRALGIIMMMTTMFSCSNSIDEVIDNASQKKVTLALNISEKDALTGRALESSETALTNLTLNVKGEGVAISGNEIEYTFQNPSNKYLISSGLQPGTVTVSVWANCGKGELDLKDEAGTQGFSMYSKKDATLESAEEAQTVEVVLNHTVAKIHFTDEQSSLCVEKVMIANARRYSYADKESGTTLSSGYYDAPELADMAGKYKDRNTELASLAQSLNNNKEANLYVYENPNPTEKTYTYLVIYGKWTDGNSYYYRWLINKGAIQRNYVYNLNLKAVKGPGTDDPFNDTKDANLSITSTLEPWYDGDDIEGGNLE